MNAHNEVEMLFLWTIFPLQMKWALLLPSNWGLETNTFKLIISVANMARSIRLIWAESYRNQSFSDIAAVWSHHFHSGSLVVAVELLFTYQNVFHGMKSMQRNCFSKFSTDSENIKGSNRRTSPRIRAVEL